MSERIVVWFSCGASSAVAAKLTLAEHGHEDVVIAYTDPGIEHEDNVRFMADCERWFDHPILTLRSDRYATVDDVIEKRRFLNGPEGALCTAEMKRRVRFAFERPDDTQVYGYTHEEVERANRFRANNPDVDLRTPLIDRMLMKSDCLAMIERAGIAIPVMYLLGYDHNNCIGCVKGGMGYWNGIRVDFPETFARRARQEREIGHSCIHDESGPVFLDELDPSRGEMRKGGIECSLLCAIAEGEYR